MIRRRKSYFERLMAMSDAERDAAVALFDKERIGLPGSPLTAGDVALHGQAELDAARRRKSNRPKRVMVTVESELLRKADSYARRKGLSRSQLISAGLRSILGSAA